MVPRAGLGGGEDRQTGVGCELQPLEEDLVDGRPGVDQGHGPAVTTWTADELDRIGAADELELAVLRSDGTLRDSVTIWVVRHRDDLYVRSWRGRDGSWYRSAHARGEGHISAGGVDMDVAFLDAEHDADDAVDAAYRTKYRRFGTATSSPWSAPMREPRR